MRAKTARLIRVLIVVTAVSSAFGVVISPHTVLGCITGAFNGSIGLLIASFELVLQGRFADAMRRLPVALVFALRMAAYCVIIAGIFLADQVIAGIWFPASTATLSLFSVQTLGLAIAFTLAMNLFFVFSGLLGMRVLTSLLTGRYHRPRDEERIVLFLDLEGSTRIAETLGDREFLRFLSQVFLDIADPVIEAGGEIYRYVGDEIIITWLPARGFRDAACVSCLFEIEDAIIRRQQVYLAQFGAEPRLRGALHVGRLIVGEMGGIKREIVMLGDTMNTTARIENICRQMQRRYIASAAVIDRLPALPTGVHADSLGSVALRGKQSATELFGLSRS